MKQRNINEILESVYKEGLVRKIIANIAKGADDPDLEDLEQDIYECLLNKGDAVVQMDASGQLKYFIAKMVMNNICSKTSRWYYIYKKNKMKSIPLNEWKEAAD